MVCWAKRIVWRNALIGVYAAIVVVGLVVFFPLSVPVLPPQQWLAYTEKIHFKPKDSENHARFYCRSSLLTVSDGRIWREQVSGIYNALPPQERAKTGILASNYGQAGAINILGAKIRFADCDQRPPELLDLGAARVHRRRDDCDQQATLDEMNAAYNSCTVVGERNGPYAMPWEHGPIYLCHGRKTTIRRTGRSSSTTTDYTPTVRR